MRVEESCLKIDWITTVERADLRSWKLNSVDKTTGRRVNKPNVGAGTEAANVENAIGDDVHARIYVTRICVSVLSISRLALDSSFFVVVPELLDEVLLAKEIPNLSCETDISRCYRAAVN